MYKFSNTNLEFLEPLNFLSYIHHTTYHFMFPVSSFDLPTLNHP